MNPLYQQMQPQQNNSLLQRFQQFRQQFQGDPRQQIQQMMNSGKINQNQYNQAVQMAQRFQQMFKGMF
jgi:hypothetical protein